MIRLPDDLPVLMHLLDTARDLTEPGEPNAEYIRGQVNLITDLIEVPLAGGLFGELFTRYISHEEATVVRQVMAILERGE